MEKHFLKGCIHAVSIMRGNVSKNVLLVLIANAILIGEYFWDAVMQEEEVMQKTK
jgi:hypothetical protein